jgi:hypothetical protein
VHRANPLPSGLVGFTAEPKPFQPNAFRASLGPTNPSPLLVAKEKKIQQQFTRCFLSHWGFFHSLLEQIFALGVDMVWQKPMVTLTDVMAGEYHTGISRIA